MRLQKMSSGVLNYIFHQIFCRMIKSRMTEGREACRMYGREKKNYTNVNLKGNGKIYHKHYNISKLDLIE